MLVGRFLLDLQKLASRVVRVQSDDQLHFSWNSTPSFVDRALGAIAYRASEHSIDMPAEDLGDVELEPTGDAQSQLPDVEVEGPESVSGSANGALEVA